MLHHLLGYIWENNLDFCDNIKTRYNDSVEIECQGSRLDKECKGIILYKEAEVEVNNRIYSGHVVLAENLLCWNSFKQQQYDLATKTAVVIVSKDILNSFSVSENILLLGIDIPKHLVQLYITILSSNRAMCTRFISKFNNEEAKRFYNRLIIDRMSYKGNFVSSVHENICCNDWNETFTFLLFDTIKIGTKNRAIFGELCRRVRSNKISNNLSSLEEIEALLFGTAGLLMPIKNGDEYVRKLQDIFNQQRSQYKIEPMDGRAWVFSSNGNSIPIVIAQLAALMHASIDVERDVLTKAKTANLHELLKKPVSEYWRCRSEFCATPLKTKSDKALHKLNVEKLIINAIVPLLHNYHLSENIIQYDLYMDILEKCSPDNNSIIGYWKSEGVAVDSALMSQCLLHLQKFYCTPKKCAECTIFSDILYSRH